MENEDIGGGGRFDASRAFELLGEQSIENSEIQIELKTLQTHLNQLVRTLNEREWTLIPVKDVLHFRSP